MKNTGALLKTKRESSNLSLSEVALATKINPKILTAIENGDEANLPAKTFLKGFVRSYALFLKMDVESVMRTFTDEMGGPVPVVQINPESPSPARTTAPKSRRVDEESSSGLRTAAVVVIVLLIGLIIGVRELIEKYQRERVVEASADLNKATPVAQPAQEATKESGTVPATSATVAPATDVAPDTGDTVTVDSATVPPVPKTVDTKNADTVKPEIKVVEKTSEKPQEKLSEKAPEKGGEVRSSLPPAPIISPRNLVQMPITNLVELRPTELSPPKPIESAPANASVPPPKPEKTAETPKPAEPPPAPVAAPAPAPAAETPAASAKSLKNEIILEALDKVEVKFQVKGETKRVSLGPTQVHTIHAELPMTLDLSDGGAVNIILNGRERGVPGDLGKPKTIRIP